MRPRGVHDGDMKATSYIHDDVIEAIVRGEPVHEAHAPLASFARQVQAVADEPTPTPSPQLAALLAGEPGTDVSSAGGRSGRKRMAGIDSLAGATGKVASLGLIAKLGLGASLAAAGVAGAGAAGVLPDAANHAVRGAIETVSPVEFGSEHTTDPATHPDNFGATVSADAKGDSDGVPGVDGRAIADAAPGAAHRPDGTPADEAPGQTGDTGLTKAGDTPATAHAPATPPTTQAAAAGQSDDHPATPPSTVPDPTHPEGRAGAGE